MISKSAIKEVLNLTKVSNGSFVILEKEEPKLVILDFGVYESLIEKAKRNRQEPPNLLESVIREDLPEFTEQPSPIKDETILVVGAGSQLGSIVLSKLKEKGYKTIEYGNIEFGNVEELADIFENNEINAVINLSHSDENYEKSSEKCFLDIVDAPTKLLNIMYKYNVSKYISTSTKYLFTTQGSAKLIFENILKFYHHNNGINSVTLRLPKLNAKPDLSDFENPEKLLFSNPIAAVLGTAFGKINCLSVPFMESLGGDSTPIVEISDLGDSASALIFSLEHLENSSGAMIFDMPGVKISLAKLIEETLSRTGKMVTTTHVSELGAWADEPSETKSITELGFLSNFDDLVYLIDSMKQFVNSNLTLAKKDISNEPVPLSDLLSGKFTPFIKPHNF